MEGPGEYSFKLKIDGKQLELDIEQAKKAFADLAKQAQKAGAVFNDIPNPFDQLKGGAPKVEAAKKQFDALGMSVKQLVRETPALAMGVNTYFMAISNNLPVFADAVKKVREENAALAAQGKPTVSVLKQVGGALFNWQTGLVLVVTALSMFGKKIGEWISSLFSGKQAVDAVKEAQKGLVAEIEKSGLGLDKQLISYERLRREWAALNGSLAEQKKFVRDNQDAFDDLGVAINGVTDAENWLVTHTEDFLTAMRLRAEAAAAQKLAAEQLEEALITERDLAQDRARYEAMSDTATYSTVAMGDYQGYNNTTVESFNKEKYELGQSIEAREAEAAAAREAADAYFDMAEARELEAQSRLDAAGIEEAQSSNARRTAEEARRNAETLARMRVELQRDADQAIIDAMAEGTDRQLAQIALDYQRKRDEITKREAELRRIQGGNLTSEQTLQLGMLSTSAENEYLAQMERAIFGDTEAQSNAAIERMNAEREARNEYLREYGTFQERLLATTIYWNEQINAAKTEGERMALTAERDAILARFEVEASEWAQQLVGATVSQLGTMTVQLEAELVAKRKELDAMASSTSPDAQALRDVIDELTAKIEVLRDKTDEARSSGATDDWQKSILIFQGISEAASEAADGIAEYDENIANLFRSISQIAGAVNNFVGALKSMATAISSAEKASGILAIVSAAIQVISVLSSALKSIGNSRDEFDSLIRQFRELNEEIERINRSSRIDSLKGTIFGSDAFGNFMNNLTVMRESLEAYDAAQKSIIERGKEITNAQVGYEEYGIAIAKGTWDSLEESLKNMSVLMKDRGKFAESWGFRDIYSTLGEQLPSLFGEDGVTLEGLQDLRESDVWDKLSQENRDLIDDMIANWEAYNESVEASNRYLQGIFGNLGNEINDAIVDAFKNGTDAALAFGDAAGEMLENLIKQIGYTAYLAPIFEQAMTEVEGLNRAEMTPEQYLEQLMNIIRGVMDGAGEAIDGYTEFLEKSDRMAEDRGFDVFNPDNREASRKGIAQASQDSIDELNGRMTAIQSHTSSIQLDTKQLTRDSARILYYLGSIEGHTARLGNIERHMDRMSSDIRTIATRGVKMM